MNSFLVVGKGDCSVLKVHSILRYSTSFHLFRKKWTDVAGNLNIPEVDIEAMRDDMLQNKISLSDVLKQILHLWVGGNGDTALLEKLIQSLEKNGLCECSDLLKEEFKFYPDSFKKYDSIPRTLENLLHSNEFPSGIIILITPDITITTEKIRENLPKIVTFSNYEVLLKELSAGKEWSSLILTDKDPNTLANLLENMSGNKPFDRNGKVVFITDKEEENIKGTLILLGASLDYVKIIIDEMEWNDLNLSAKYEVRKRAECYVGFRLQSALLEKALSGKVLVDLLNSRKDLQLIKSTLPDSCSYYIKRNLLTRNLISEEVFKASCQDVLLFQGISRSELSAMIKGKLTANSSEQLQRVTSKFIVLEELHHFTKICQLSNDPVHLVRKEEDGKWIWIKSKGRIENIQTHILTRKAQANVEEKNLWRKMSERTFEENISVCISDSPGMGKSFLLARIGRRLKRRFPERVVAFLVLPELIQEVHRNWTDDIKAAVRLSIAKLVGENHLGELFLQSKLNADDCELMIELLLDGFDEVDYSEHGFSHEVLMAIKSFKSVRLWVTSRPHLLEELEQTLSVLGYNMQAFSDENQIQFLTRFWSERLEMQKGDFKNFAATCLQVLKKSVNSSDDDIAGIPLQCLMIAEIFQDEAKANAGLSSATSSTESFTFIDLYDLLIKKKIELYYKKHDGSNTLAQEEILDIHKRLSLQLLFPDCVEKVLPMSELVEKCGKEILKIGLLETSSTLESPRFIHRTFAEYLTALFAVETLGSDTRNAFNDLFYDQILINKLAKYTEFNLEKIYISNLEIEIVTRNFLHSVICYFLNFLLFPGDNIRLPVSKHLSQYSTIQEIILASVTHNFVNILNLFSEDQVVKKFERFIFNKNLLLAAVKHANLHLIKVVFTHFEKSNQLNEKTQEEVFSLAIEKMEFSVVEFLLKDKECEEIMKRDDRTEYIRSLLVCCATHTGENDLFIARRIEIIHLLLELNKDATNKHLKELVLKDGVNVKILIDLINLGADVLERDSENETILHKASEAPNEIDFEKIIQHIPIEKLRQLVSMSAEHDPGPLWYLTCSYLNFEPTFVTLKCLKDAGANFDNTRNRKSTHDYVISAATTYGSSREALKNLVRVGADVNWQGKKGRNLLHLAAKHGNLEGVRYYVDELKFDVNIVDSNWMTPMDYSIMDFSDKRNAEIKTLLNERGGLSNIAHLCVQSNLKMCYKELASIIGELLRQVDDDKVGYLRRLSSKSELEIKNLLIITWLKVSWSTSVLNWVEKVGYCIVSFVDIIKHLDNEGADLYETDLKGRNFLNRFVDNYEWDHDNILPSLVSSSFHDISEYLIEKNHSKLFSQRENEQGSTPFQLAVQKIKLEERTFRLLHNANVSFGQVDFSGNNLLVYALWGINDDKVFLTTLINLGVDWKCRNFDGWNLLHQSALTGNVTGLKYLLNLGLSPKEVDNKGRSPLMIYLQAEHHGNLKFVKLLCEFGTDINRKDGLGMAALDYLNKNWSYHRIEILKYLVEKGADVYAKDNQNRSFIHKCISKDSVTPSQFRKLVECLIQNKLTTALEVGGLENNSTPLHLALNKMEVNEATLVLLQSAGINFNYEDNNGDSLLIYAIKGCRSLNLIDMLIRYGADIFHLDKNGSSVLHLAAGCGNAESLDFLILRAKLFEEVERRDKNVVQYKVGLDANKQNNNGNTPMHYALLEKDIKELEKKIILLLEAGADAHIINNDGVCPFAILMHRPDINEDIKAKLGGSLPS